MPGCCKYTYKRNQESAVIFFCLICAFIFVLFAALCGYAMNNIHIGFTGVDHGSGETFSGQIGIYFED